MNGRRGYAGAMAILGLALAAEAHLVAGSLSIKGNENLKVGETVVVKWTVSIVHAPGKFDLNLSTNGGTSFELADTVTFPLVTGERSFAWTVPNKPSTTAQFQVCQHAGSNRCEYTLKSGNFTIETSSSISLIKANMPNSHFTYDPNTKNLEFSFDLPQEEHVKILVLDLQGKEVVSLMDSKIGRGKNKRSIHSNALNAKKTYLVQIRIGSHVFANELHLN